MEVGTRVAWKEGQLMRAFPLVTALLKAERFNNGGMWVTGETSRKLPEIEVLSFILDLYW